MTYGDSQHEDWWDGWSEANRRLFNLPVEFDKYQAQVFARDGYRCANCGGADRMCEAYIIGWELGRMITEYPTKQAVTICCDCFDLPETQLRFLHA